MPPLSLTTGVVSQRQRSRLISERSGSRNSPTLHIILWCNGSTFGFGPNSVIINEEGIKHSKELVELEGLETFALQEIRNQKLEDLGV